MFPIEKYHCAQSVADAVRALNSDKKARIIAGGTDVLVRLHDNNSDYARLVDINSLTGLKRIWMEKDGTVYIGTLATCTEIIEHPVIQEHLPMVASSLATIGGPQVRNVATMGGNICNGAVSADSACAALVHEMDLAVESLEGERIISINGFHVGPGKTVLNQGDLFKWFIVRPEHYRGYGAAYEKYAMRGAMDIATIGCGSAVKVEDGRIETLKLAFTVAAPTPIRCPHAEEWAKGKPMNNETLNGIAERVEKDVTPRTSWRAEREFRLHIIKTLARRVTRRAGESRGGINQ